MVFKKYVISISTAANACGALTIVFMMLLTCADVVLRLFRHPIPGTYEIVGMAGTIAVSFALGATTIQKSHIAVEFITQRFPKNLRIFIAGTNDFIAFLFFSLLAWRSAVYAHDLKMSGEVSLTVQIPLYPFVWGVAIGCSVISFVLISQAAKHFQRSLSR